MRARYWAGAAVVILFGGGVALPAVTHAARGTPTIATAATTTPARVAADDTATLGRLLRAVRGADPLFCELAARSVDGYGWWSTAGNESGGALEVDSVAAEVVRWLREDHRGPRLVPALTAAMHGSDACGRRLAGSLLGRVQDPGAVAALRDALDDANADVRTVAALGIGRSKDRASLQPLIRRLKDPSPGVRRASAWALGELEDKAALLPLIEVLNGDTDARVRQAAAWALGEVAG